MTNPFDKNPGLPASGEGGSPSSRQETILLTTVPTATQLTQEISGPQFTDPSLTSNTLAALSQRYDILAEAGHGAMGNVYKARDRETGETVALKLLKPEIASDQAMMERFKNELLFARKITHKNVCRVHDFNRIGGIAFTSMEFVEGESLRAVLNRFGGFPVRKGVDLAIQICSGLQEAHAQGIVHRDLKPENVMIDANGNVKIMDFGIARSMEALTKLTGAMIGTPAYMAPEQVAGKSVDYRTDIYSLGLILYEMFTGSQAFQADTAVAVALKQMRETPRSPHEIEPSIPVGIERVILKCLEKEPARRFQSVAELAAALRAPSVLGSNPAAFTPVPVAATPVREVSPTPYAPPVVRKEAKRTSPLVWVLLGAFVVLATLGAMRAKAIWQQAEQVSPPSELPAPVPPGIASEKAAEPPATTSATAAKPAAKPAPKKAVSEKPQVAASKPALPQTPPASKFATQPPAQNNLEAQQRQSEKILSQDANPEGESNRKKYLWIGRYQKEEGAQNAAKKLEDLGQPAVILPRHGPSGEFFVVFTGPFPGSRIPNVTQWLESQGFRNVRPVNSPNGGGGNRNGEGGKAKSNEGPNQNQ
jgi:serine/threonine protein kinase